jgi:hypothetical protein
MGLFSKKSKKSAGSSNAASSEATNGERECGILQGADRSHLVEPKYAVEMSDRRLELMLNKCSKEYGEAVRDNFEKLGEAADRPAAMAYFDRMLGLDSPRPEELQKLKLQGKKIIGYY